MRLTEARVGWRVGDWVVAGARLVAVLILGLGTANAIAAENPPMRPTQELVDDLEAGKVEHLEYQSSSRTVRWSTGWWHWRETVPPPLTNDGAAPDDWPRQWLRQLVEASGQRVPVQVRHGDPGWWLPGQVPQQPFQGLAIGAWFGALLLMLFSAEHRYANRWAWFWLFTVGQVGALLYLLFEPRPIWRPRSWAEQVDRRSPMGGGAGCGWSILLSIAAPLLVLGITTVFG